MIIHLVSKQVYVTLFLDIIWIIIIGILHLESPHFILHTEPSVSPPEFSIICHTHGGPATNVVWFLPLPDEMEFIDSERSQLIVDTSQNSTYENRLLVKGRYSGKCHCTINNNIQDYFPTASYLVQKSVQITGMTIIIVYVSLFSSDMYSCW